MKLKILAVCMSLLSLVSTAYAEDSVLCSPVPTIVVFDKDLRTPLFIARQYETVLRFQNFGQTFESANTFNILNRFSQIASRYNDFKNYLSPAEPTPIYVRVEFTDRQEEEAENNVGWINQAFIKPQSKCAGYKQPTIVEINDEADDQLTANSTDPFIQNISQIDLSIQKCCTFPLKRKPTESYADGMRRFGAGRSNGTRAHAAADLYQAQYEPVYAIASGKILRDRVSFYLGTTVTEIEHSGGFIARYGEIAGANLKPLKLGSTVIAGQLIGYIKKVNAKSVSSAMLHFELYTGKSSGPLTTRKGKYQRRSDLINPTQYLAQWEKRLK